MFSNVSIPKYMAMARNGLPGYDNLPPDCKGALLSLVYNRGASFTKAGARYAEMRAIRAAVQSGNLAEIPGLFRKMKRLWTTASVRGVALRRDRAAELFEAGMRGGSAAVSTVPVAPRDRRRSGGRRRPAEVHDRSPAGWLMTSSIRLLRHLLLMPEGNPAQQEKDVAAVVQELRSGKERVRAARVSIEKSQELRATFVRLLERT